MPSNPSDFLQRAVQAGHPKSLENYVSQAVHEVAMDNFHLPPYLVAKKRIDFFKSGVLELLNCVQKKTNFKQTLKTLRSSGASWKTVAGVG